MVARDAQPADPSPATIADLEAIYQFREPDAVRSFLAAHPEILDVVIEAASKIPEFLPVEEPPVLELVRDHDDEDDDGDLFAVVSTRLEPEDLRPRMAEFRTAWLVDAVCRAQGRFNVGILYA